MGDQGKPQGHWPGIAGLWHHVGPPLRPAAADIETYALAVDEWRRASGRAPRAMILGVTPELYDLLRPVCASLTAIDRSAEMIRQVWPGPADAVVCCDWNHATITAGSLDLVVSDGGLAMLPFPQGQRDLAHALQGWLGDDGRCIFRVFEPASKPEPLEDVLASLHAGSIESLNELKLRLWRSLQVDVVAGVEPRRVLEIVLQAAEGDLLTFSRRLGWPEAHVLALETHRGSGARYHLVGARDLEPLFCAPGSGFVFHSSRHPAGRFGHLAPVVVFDRKQLPADVPDAAGHPT